MEQKGSGKEVENKNHGRRDYTKGILDANPPHLYIH